MKASCISLIAAAVIFCGCAGHDSQKARSAQTKVTAYEEHAVFLRFSSGLSLFDPQEVTPIATNTLNWQRFRDPMTQVHTRPPNRPSDSFEFGYPRIGYRPEYLIDTGYQPQINLKDLDR